MALTTTNGMSIDDLSAAPNGPGLAQQLGNQVDAFYGGSVANAAALPASGKFAGQRVWLVDVKSHAIWTGSAWDYDTAWVVPTLGSSWTSFDAGAAFDNPAYCRKGGVVHLKGAIKGGTSGTAFTLPTGMRPLKRRAFASIASAGSISADIRIESTGALAVAFYGTSATNAFVSLDNIRFIAEQ